MIRSLAAAAFALLIAPAPARATFVDPTYAPQVLDLNLIYPGGNFTSPGGVTLTGNLDIGLGAPGVAPYIVGQGGGLSVNGDPIMVLATEVGHLVGVGDNLGIEIGISTPPYTDPNYGNPLNLTPSEIYFNGIIASGGTVTCTAECNEAVSPVPLPAAFPLFGSALAGLGGFGWWKRRGRFGASARRRAAISDAPPLSADRHSVVLQFIRRGRPQ